VEPLNGWWSKWVAGPPDRWVSLGLFVAILLLSPSSTRQSAVSMHLILLGGTLALSFRWRVAPLALIALLFAGIDLRLTLVDTSYSDVAVVTRAAIERVLDGGNPYGVGYAVSQPSGSPFAYGPLALLWYSPWHDPGDIDLVLSIGILAVLIVRGHLLGAAIYASAPVLLIIAGDGSNDTSAGLLILIALVAVPRAPRAAAALLGLAVAFKPYAVAWALPLLAWAGASTALPLLVGASLFWLPALAAWGPAAIAGSFVRSQHVEVDPWYSLGEALTRYGSPVPREVLDVLRYVVGAVAAVAVSLAVRSPRGVILGGIVIFLATMYTGYWSTFAYFSAVAPVICWFIDDWLGEARRRIPWPGDPVGALTAAVDRRWPATETRPPASVAAPQ
jgi:hypothetical protein